MPFLCEALRSRTNTHIINLGIKFSEKKKLEDNTLRIEFQDFCKERVSNGYDSFLILFMKQKLMVFIQVINSFEKLESQALTLFLNQ